MKYLFFFVIIYVHFFILTQIKLFDEPYLILSISLSISTLGGLFYFIGEKKGMISDIGWGILFGGVTSLVLIFGFLLFLIIALGG